jgi:hypothetical protein
MTEGFKKISLPVKPIPSDRAWFDGRLITSATYQRRTRLQITGGTQGVIAPANSNRVAIGISRTTGGFGSFFAAPWTEPNIDKFLALPADTIAWFTIFDYFSLIGNVWYLFASTTETFNITEILRTGG